MSPIIFDIREQSQMAEARRAARALAVRLGFDETAAERVAIVASETATNLLKHARTGRLVLSAIVEETVTAVEVLALDRGPGMSNVLQCFGDGYSTTGTAGTGLGAISRLSAFCDIYSIPGAGTALVARVTNNSAAKQPGVAVRGIDSAMPGQDVCGDAWAVSRTPGRVTVLLADGLGHGPGAAAAARAAVGVMLSKPGMNNRDLVAAVHLALRPTRGAAVALATFYEEERKVTFSGLGNISARICQGNGSSTSMVSVNGTAGLEARLVREFVYDWPPGSVAILHSDGLHSRWDLEAYPGLVARDASIISGILFRDHCRGTDDASVVAVR